MIQSGKQSDRSIYKWVIRMQPTYTINNKMSYILGISAYYHDAAAALIKDGEIIAAAQEERFTRIKNDASFPANAIRYCLQQAGILLCDISTIIYYEKPYLKFERILEIFIDTHHGGWNSSLKEYQYGLKKNFLQTNAQA